jgi:hypothetical protein
MKTSELINLALNWAVMKAEGPDSFAATVYYDGDTPLRIDDQCDVPEIWDPSTNWAQGGPIIEREELTLSCHWQRPYAIKVLVGEKRVVQGNGPTPLIAAMRCYVASKLGDDIEVPEELK